MTKMLIDRTLVEQALQIVENTAYPLARSLIKALRAALADQQEPGFWGRVAARQASRIKQLEATGQQALEAMRCAVPTGKITLTDWMKANRDLEAALAEPVQEPDTCTWQQDGDNTSGAYGTSCRHYFHLEDGTPEDNKMKWCCYCGKRLAQELITEDEDE